MAGQFPHPGQGFPLTPMHMMPPGAMVPTSGAMMPMQPPMIPQQNSPYSPMPVNAPEMNHQQIAQHLISLANEPFRHRELQAVNTGGEMMLVPTNSFVKPPPSLGLHRYTQSVGDGHVHTHSHHFLGYNAENKPIDARMNIKVQTIPR